MQGQVDALGQAGQSLVGTALSIASWMTCGGVSVRCTYPAAADRLQPFQDAGWTLRHTRRAKKHWMKLQGFRGAIGAGFYEGSIARHFP